eukprot:scaffold135_cov249-Pinguiococcus_pyrenoidosus.AAC.18
MKKTPKRKGVDIGNLDDRDRENSQPKAESRKPKAESRKPKAESRKPKAESRKPNAKIPKRQLRRVPKNSSLTAKTKSVGTTAPIGLRAPNFRQAERLLDGAIDAFCRCQRFTGEPISCTPWDAWISKTAKDGGAAAVVMQFKSQANASNFRRNSKPQTKMRPTILLGSFVHQNSGDGFCLHRLVGACAVRSDAAAARGCPSTITPRTEKQRGLAIGADAAKPVKDAQPATAARDA